MAWPPEFADEAGVAHGDRVENVADVDAWNGAGRALDLARRRHRRRLLSGGAILMREARIPMTPWCQPGW